jgi:LL-diaminopimelate aminotransferase
MGIGDPDLPTPPHVIEALKRAAEVPANHRYPDYEGLLSFRTAVADWYRGRFGVTLDPRTEVLTLIGSKEGTAHMPLAFVNPGDVVLVPDPGYPVYAAGTWFAGGEVHFMPLRRANRFLPDLDAIPAEVAKRAKLMYLNYPNNPTAAVATPEFFAKVVDFARRHRIMVCHDAMYLSCASTVTGRPSWRRRSDRRRRRVPFARRRIDDRLADRLLLRNAGAIAGLGKIKTNVDSGSAAVQKGIAALTGPQISRSSTAAPIRAARRVVAGLAPGWDVDAQGRLRLGPGPGRFLDPRAFAARMLNEVGADHPGVGLIPPGRVSTDRAHHRRQAPAGGDGPPGAQAVSDKYSEDVRFYGTTAS